MLVLQLFACLIANAWLLVPSSLAIGCTVCVVQAISLLQ